MQAFAISFSYTDRYKAQQVVRELIGKFEEQNLVYMTKTASVTTEFLSDELKNAKQHLDDLDQKLTQFKVANQGRLPEQFQSNVQAENAAEAEAGRMADALSQAQARKVMLEQSLQNLTADQNFYTQHGEEVVPGTPTGVKSQQLISLEASLTQQKSNLASMLKLYGDNYPEITSLKASISVAEAQKAELEKQLEAQAAATPDRGPQKVANPARAGAARGTEEQRQHHQDADPDHAGRYRPHRAEPGRGEPANRGLPGAHRAGAAQRAAIHATQQRLSTRQGELREHGAEAGQFGNRAGPRTAQGRRESGVAGPCLAARAGYRAEPSGLGGHRHRARADDRHRAGRGQGDARYLAQESEGRARVHQPSRAQQHSLARERSAGAPQEAAVLAGVVQFLHRRLPGDDDLGLLSLFWQGLAAAGGGRRLR